jgi:hypothetical protein
MSCHGPTWVIDLLEYGVVVVHLGGHSLARRQLATHLAVENPNRIIMVSWVAPVRDCISEVYYLIPPLRNATVDEGAAPQQRAVSDRLSVLSCCAYTSRMTVWSRRVRGVRCGV